jgi:flagellar L-ring protein precursor FlgH
VPRTDGAIYQAGQQMELFADLKARRVGDVLTIVLNETTNASKSAVTKTAKTTSVVNTGPTLFGKTITVQGRADTRRLVVGRRQLRRRGLEHAEQQPGRQPDRDGDRGAGERQSHRAGRQDLKLNQGDEFVHISGVIRPADIADQQHGHLRQARRRAHQLLRQGRHRQLEPHGLAGAILQFAVLAVLGTGTPCA